MLLDLLQTVGTERCHPPNPESPRLAPSTASFLEGQPSSSSSFNSLGKAFPGPSSLSSLLLHGALSDLFFRSLLWGLSPSTQFLVTLCPFSCGRVPSLFSAFPLCVFEALVL